MRELLFISSLIVGGKRVLSEAWLLSVSCELCLESAGAQVSDWNMGAGCWSIELEATFRVVDVAELADSAESLIDEEMPDGIFRLDTIWIEDDPLERGDAFAKGDSLFDAQDPHNALWVAFEMFLPSWAGLRGDIDVEAKEINNSLGMIEVHLSSYDHGVSISDVSKLQSWLGVEVLPISWIGNHFQRFVREIKGAELVAYTLKTEFDDGGN
jgi:hypothetical protein